MQLTDPPALWDFAMDAASNLSFSRAVLLRGARASRRPGLPARILNGVGVLLWTAWPRLKQTEDTEVGGCKTMVTMTPLSFPKL